jgi:hypothetical protein
MSLQYYYYFVSNKVAKDCTRSIHTIYTQLFRSLFFTSNLHSFKEELFLQQIKNIRCCVDYLLKKAT